MKQYTLKETVEVERCVSPIRVRVRARVGVRVTLGGGAPRRPPSVSPPSTLGRPPPLSPPSTLGTHLYLPSIPHRSGFGLGLGLGLAWLVRRIGVRGRELFLTRKYIHIYIQYGKSARN